ncbi:pyridoxal phosphate-dependent transferase [Xylariales sp. PMI_506]|nr:pyridoxal phosphate-dependent transferase [Xylariales sp. PMI_506]
MGSVVPEKKLINLQLGWPNPDLLPRAAVAEATAAVMAMPDVGGPGLNYRMEVGDENFRKNVADFVQDIYTPDAGPVTPDRIFLSTGASAALAIILTKFTQPGITKRAWMVEPTYFLACPTFHDAGFADTLCGIPEDDEGIDTAYFRQKLEEIEKEEPLQDIPLANSFSTKPKIYKHVLYCVPTFSNPSGKTMSLRRRKELVQIAQEFDVLVIADDVYDVLRWPVTGDVLSESELPQPPPRLIDIERSIGLKSPFGNTLSNGSFSKILAPGMRSGWVEGSPELIKQVLRYGVVISGGNQGGISATVVNQLLISGALKKHIFSTLIPFYHRQYQTLVGEVQKHLGPFGITISTGQQYDFWSRDFSDEKAESAISSSGKPVLTGGFFMYLKFPSTLPPVDDIVQYATEKYSVRIAPGMMGAVIGDKEGQERAKHTFASCARLCWAWHTEEDVVEGIRRLAQAIDEMQK